MIITEGKEDSDKNIFVHLLYCFKSIGHLITLKSLHKGHVYKLIFPFIDEVENIFKSKLISISDIDFF